MNATDKASLARIERKIEQARREQEAYAVSIAAMVLAGAGVPDSMTKARGVIREAKEAVK